MAYLFYLNLKISYGDKVLVLGKSGSGKTTFLKILSGLTPITAGKIYTPATATYNTSNQFFSYNFGNGTFGTTAVASAGSNASGVGIFEYDVPAGYAGLSTKGLNL